MMVHSKAETSVSGLHVPRRLEKELMRFEVEMPKWVAKSTSDFVERSEEGVRGSE